MNAAEILVVVQQAGATLRVEGDSLVASNASRIAPAIKAAIRENKPQIIAALAKPACAVCGATDDLWHLDTAAGPLAVHPECAEFLPQPEPAAPSAAYQAASPDCAVTIVEIPAVGLRYRRTFAHLQLKPPDHVPEDRWKQCVEDGKRFLAAWGSQAEALGWTSADLFGLHIPPAKPHHSYNRLSCYDATGLCWLLEGCPVVAVTADSASIRRPTGSVTVCRKHSKPALGPVGGSFEDFTL